MHQKDQEMKPQRVVAEDVGFRANENSEELLTPLKVQEEDPKFREEDPDQSTVKPTGELKPLRATLNTFDEGSIPQEKELQLMPFRNFLSSFLLFLVYHQFPPTELDLNNLL